MADTLTLKCYDCDHIWEHDRTKGPFGMHAYCPKCGSAENDESYGEDGRDLHLCCVACGHRWVNHRLNDVASDIKTQPGLVCQKCQAAGKVFLYEMLHGGSTSVMVNPSSIEKKDLVEQEQPKDRTEDEEEDPDQIDHPPHYNAHPFIECIDVVEHFSFNLGNAIKYIWRCQHKGNKVEDLEKAIWYIQRELEMDEKLKEEGL